ncbi:hypothetical protein, partial [Neisseria sicca]|uniref:hypothetical protein n=1 Tax=Neisseria sicca TaxID=490 RepID=UPI001C998AFC
MGEREMKEGEMGRGLMLEDMGVGGVEVGVEKVWKEMVGEKEYGWGMGGGLGEVVGGGGVVWVDVKT